jgi:hypothetical protein
VHELGPQCHDGSELTDRSMASALAEAIRGTRDGQSVSVLFETKDLSRTTW